MEKESNYIRREELKQGEFMKSTTLKSVPDVQEIPRRDFTGEQRRHLNSSQLSEIAEVRGWVATGSNSAVNYSTHGLFRYFGKFPAPIARKMILAYSNPEDFIIDPACGSGTTAVESLLLGRKAYVSDVNPFAALLTKVKTTRVDPIQANVELAKVLSRARRKRLTKSNYESIREINVNHWFLPETQSQIARIEASIREVLDESVRDLMSVGLASIIRKVSKATSQQGRLFLDQETAMTEVLPVFERAVVKAIGLSSELPKNARIKVDVNDIREASWKTSNKSAFVIFHPPYFNAYRYSSINSLEMAWLGYSTKDTRSQEIREYFKSGHPKNLPKYISDMRASLKNIRVGVSDNSSLCLMIGDSRFRGDYVPVTRAVIESSQDLFNVEEIIMRVPMHTEASWAASQRRKAQSLSDRMFDFILVMKPC